MNRREFVKARKGVRHKPGHSKVPLQEMVTILQTLHSQIHSNMDPGKSASKSAPVPTLFIDGRSFIWWTNLALGPI